MALYLYNKSSWLVSPLIERIQGTMMFHTVLPMSIKASSMNIKPPTLSIGSSRARCDAMERGKTAMASEYHMNRRITTSGSQAAAQASLGGYSSPQPDLVDEPIYPSVPSAFPRLYGKYSPSADLVSSANSSTTARRQELPTLKRVDSKEWIKDFKTKRERIDKINFNNIFGGIDVQNNDIPSLPPLNTSLGNSSAYEVPSSPSSTSSQHSSLSADDLSPHDVICGRGGKANSHPGNISFRSEALKLRSWYESSSKSEKYTISNMLVDYVKERGGRFLKRDEMNPGQWLECDGNDVRKKASQALREGKLKESK